MLRRRSTSPGLVRHAALRGELLERRALLVGTAVIQGLKWNDLDGDHQRDAGEAPLSGWTIYLDRDQNGVLSAGDTSTVTDGSGVYRFTNLDAGAYTVREVPQSTWQQTYPGSATVANGSFEVGTLSGWSYVGQGRVEAAAPLGVTPPDLAYQAVIDNELTPASDSELEAFLGLATGTLDALAAGDALEGAAIRQELTVNAGDILSFRWNFLTNENTPEPDFNDYAFLAVSPAGAAVVASTGSTTFVPLGGDFAEQTGYRTYNHAFASGGNYRVGFGVVDVNDVGISSALLVDAVTLATQRISGAHRATLSAGQTVSGLDFGNQQQLYDFGDALGAGVPTLAGSGGAYHLVSPGLQLGPAIDADADGQPSSLADGDDLFDSADDEDGVQLVTPIVAGQTASVSVSAPGGGTLDAWIDFNSDGDWNDLGERIFNHRALSVGLANYSFAVPSSTVDGQGSARFRVSAAGVDSAGGYGQAGEVEDYRFQLSTAELDWGDAPDVYHTRLASGGAFHLVLPGFQLGQNVDIDADGQPNATADGDDLAGTPDDEDGVVLPDVLTAGEPATIQVTAPAGGVLDAWLDAAGNGTFDDVDDRLIAGQQLSEGVNELTVSVPAGAASGTTFARFRLSLNGVASFDGFGGEGEVEDYRALVQAGAQVVARRVFYNNSIWDGNDPAAGAGDDDALAPDKAALLPGQTATFANYTSYSRGINGLAIDVQNLASANLTAADFEFRAGNNNAVAAWPVLGTIPSILVRPGAGTAGSTRVHLVWPDGSISKQWLQVTVRATANTGLTAADVFYFGNAIGETGNSTTNALVNAGDEIGARANARNPLNPAPIDFRYDFNRDKLVNASDQIVARVNSTNPLTALVLLAPPAESAAGATSLAAVPDLFLAADPLPLRRRRR